MILSAVGIDFTANFEANFEGAETKNIPELFGFAWVMSTQSLKFGLFVV
jgi:hypothetical protein